ncbi:MAG: acetyltransferase [Pyrinomonadaceae bacterium]
MAATSSESIALIGCGGHAKVVLSTLQEAGHSVEAIFDDNPEKWGTQLLGIPVRGSLSELSSEGFRRALIAVGNNAARARIAGQFRDVEWVTAVHPRSYVHPTVTVGEGCVIFAGAVIQPDTSIGAHSIINTGATVDHDCMISSYVHVAPGAHLAGSVKVKEGALIGIGAAVGPGCHIGEWTVIGAGSVVLQDVSSHVTAVGVPAIPLRKKE